MPKYTHYLLAGDCGGTNTRLSLIGLTSAHVSQSASRLPPGDVLKSSTYLNENFKSFDDILRHFLYTQTPVITPLPSHCVLAAAGPVAHNAVLFTNNGWLISGEGIVNKFGGNHGVKSATLINDFVGCGYGVLTVDKEKECVLLNDAIPVEGAPIVCVGAGTGLGECYLTSAEGDVGTYECFASEGGHAEFAPRSTVEFELLQYLSNKFGGNHRVSVERVVSGTGLANVYEFFAMKYPDMKVQAVYDEFLTAGSMQGRVVATNADKCQVCRMSMETFAAAYGSEVGVAGLKWIPRGGLYVTGGLTPKNIDWIKGDQSVFMKAFKDKGRVAPLLEEIPVWAVMVEDLGLRGSHKLAHKQLIQDLSGGGGGEASRSRKATNGGWGLMVTVAVGSAVLGAAVAAVALGKKR